MNSLTLDSPAKVNLMLSVHGPRGDGYHALTSLVAALDFGDTLHVSFNTDGIDHLSCTDPTVPTDGSNLILKAAAVFRARLGEAVSFDFDLDKRIPLGAGLGGGSSNAAVALCAMNQLTGSRLDRQALLELSADLGSDCPFFIDAVPAIMSGRGEQLEVLPGALADRLRTPRILLFRPEFGIHTAWAYRRLAEASPKAYESEAIAQARLREFEGAGNFHQLLKNTFEPVVGAKYLAIPCLLEQLRMDGHACLMSGSGSCCFALAQDAAESLAIRERCLDSWGRGIFIVETSIR